MDSALCCAKCGEVVIKSMGTSMKIRAKVFVVNETSTIAICKGCGSDIPIPLVVDTNLIKSMERTAKLRLYVRK